MNIPKNTDKDALNVQDMLMERQTFAAPEPLKVKVIEEALVVQTQTGDAQAWQTQLCETLGVEDLEAAHLLLSQLVQATTKLLPANAEFINGLLAILQTIAPKDSVEAMLVVQMIACNTHAIRMLRKANQAHLEDEAQHYLALSNKLMKTYLAQVQALAKHRRGGEQTVRVEHITINGGQSIIGNVNRGGGKA